MKELSPRLIDALIRMRPEEVALRLQQVRRQPLRAEAIVERKRGLERCIQISICSPSRARPSMLSNGLE